jgi:hypothetical protein
MYRRNICVEHVMQYFWLMENLVGNIGSCWEPVGSDSGTSSRVG